MQRLGRYEILEEVGRGGMGVVYRAVDTAIGRTVAMKVVRLSEYATPQEARTLRERLFREARAAGGLTHNNIVTVYDVGQEGDTAYIVMEFVHGRTLDELVAETTAPRAETWCLQVLEDTARALDYAHARGVFHRDIKPANIMVQDDGTVKVTDFGIAKVTWTKTMTETGMVIGSPYYMAPEQLKGEPVTGRTDQFALGGVAYTLLTGRKPFDADTVASLFHKILYEEPVRAQAFNPTLSPQVERVLGKAMAKDPGQRYPGCSDFVEALKAAWAPRAQPARLPPTRKARSVRWLAVAAVVAGVLAVCALAGYLLLRSQQAVQVEITYWDSITARGDAARFEQYLQKYPSGRFADLARREIEALRRPAPAPVKSSPVAEPPKPAPAKPSPAREEKRGKTLAAPVEQPPTPSPPPIRLPAPGEVRTNPVDGQRYVWIPPARFQMGCSPGDDACDGDEKPAHPVTITKGFWLGQTEVTIEAFGGFVRGTQRSTPPAPSFPQDRDHPVVNVTWDDAVAYCRWAGGRLPTEAEWEYAARAGTTGAHYGELDAIAWYSANSGKQTHPVAQKAANGFSLYDMLGNVWEWVGDWYGNNYYAWADPRDPRGPPSGDGRVLRGGSWSGNPGLLRASSRSRNEPVDGTSATGSVARGK